MRKRRSESDLKLALEHLLYERNMLLSLANGISSGIAGNSIINNALIESFAIHVRNLIDFFWSDKPKNDHVIAEDFFEDKNDWFTKRPQLSSLLKNSRIRSHKEIAHLSYDRLRVQKSEKNWQVNEIVKDIEKAFKIFSKNKDV